MRTFNRRSVEAAARREVYGTLEQNCAGAHAEIDNR